MERGVFKLFIQSPGHVTLLNGAWGFYDPLVIYDHVEMARGRFSNGLAPGFMCVPYDHYVK
jgi:hypothetical protein